MAATAEGEVMAPDLEVRPDGTKIDWSDYTITLPDGTLVDDPAEVEEHLQAMDWASSMGAGPQFDTSLPLPEPQQWLMLVPHSSTPVEFLGFGGTAVAVLAACCLLPLWARRLCLPLAAVGAVALTAYAAHVVLIWVFPWFAVGGTSADGTVSNWPLLALVGILVGFALMWRSTLGRGPLETLLRAVSVRAARID